VSKSSFGPKAERSKKSSGFQKSPKVSPPISTSAQTLLAPTRPANVAVNGRVSGDEAAQQGGVYWLVLWLVLVAVAALLVVVILGVR
jgi:hypothetical protein